jgi:hypothetical protein
MASISVSSAVGEGFSLIRRQPVPAAVWALILVGFTAGRILLDIPLYSGLFSQLAAGGKPDLQALAPRMQQVQAIGSLLSLVGLLINGVLICAVFRAVLHPEDRRYAYLRIGVAEIIQAVMFIVITIVFVLGALIAAIPIGIVAAIIGQGSPAGAAGFGVVAVLAIFAAMIYVGLRLSFIMPMMIDDGEFDLGRAWRLTTGRVGSLFLIGLMLMVMLFVGEIVIFGAVLAVLVATVGGFDQFQTFFQQPPQTILERLTPVLVIGGLGWLALFSCAVPIFYAPWARAYRDLKQTDLAATFS